MKRIELNNRIEKDPTSFDIQMVDLVIDGVTIETGEVPNASYYFWQDIEEAAQKAMKRLEEGNTKQMVRMFDPNIFMTPKEREARFLSHLEKQHPDLDTPRLLTLIDETLGKIRPNGPANGEHPNPFLKFRLTDHIVTATIAMVLSEYLKEPKK